MNKIVFALAAFLFSVAALAEDAPPSGFKVVAAVVVNGEPVMVVPYPHAAFDDESACKVFVVNDPDILDFGLRLMAAARQMISPNALVGGACIPAVPPEDEGEEKGA